MALPVILVATILTALVTIIGCLLGNSDFWGYYPGMIWSRIICTVLLLPVSVYGTGNIQKDKPYIIIANHQSIFDVFLIYGYLGIKFKWMMKKELERIPLVGTACKKAGFIYIDRSSKAGSRNSILETEEVLKRGMSMTIFPEGTRTPTGETGRFKKGAFLLAAELHIPLLPVTINGAFNVMSRRAKIVSRHPMSITVHEPIDVADTEGMSPAELNGYIRSLSEKASDIIRQGLKSC